MTIRTTFEKPGKVFLPSSLPSLMNLNPAYYEIDPEIRRLDKMMVKKNPENREVAYKMESIIISFILMTAGVIIGDGPKIRCENEEALKVIKRWNRKVNVNRETIEDIIETSFIDMIIHGKSYYRVIPRSSEYENVDAQRIDPKTIVIRKDEYAGWRKFLQSTDKKRYYRTKKQFYRNAGRETEKVYHGYSQYRTYNVDQIDYGKYDYNYNSYSKLNINKVHIPDEPYRILFFNFFKTPPMDAALRYVIYKAFILWFMRKFSQKYWAPFVIAKIGDPKSNNYPEDPTIMQKSMEKVSAIVKNMTMFGYITVPGDVEISTLETQTARSAEIYPMYIQELDKQMMYAIFGSMGIRDARGTEVATSSTLQEMWLRLIKTWRRKYELTFVNFYTECLLPYNGIDDVEPDDIDLEWSRLTLEAPRELMESIQIGYNIGIFKNLNEMRKAAQSIFSFLEPLMDGSGEKIPEPPPKPKEAGIKEVNKKMEKLHELYEGFVKEK